MIIIVTLFIDPMSFPTGSETLLSLWPLEIVHVYLRAYQEAMIIRIDVLLLTFTQLMIIGISSQSVLFKPKFI